MTQTPLTALTLQPIRSEDDYRAALKRVEQFFDAAQEPDPESEEGAFFEALMTLVEAYERKHYPISPPDPIEAIKFRIEPKRHFCQRFGAAHWQKQSRL